MPQKQKEQTKSTPALASPSIISRVELLSQLRHTREVSVAEFRAGAPYMRTVRELQQSFTEHFLRWCDTFPALLAPYREHISKRFRPEEVNGELQATVSDIREEAKDWFSLACDGERMSSDWRCAAWFVEYPIKANSPSAHMPVDRIAGRRLENVDADELLAAIGQRFEEKLKLGSTLPTTPVPGMPNPLHSEDYWFIWYNGGWQNLSERQAQIVEVIHQEHKRGFPEVSCKLIMRKLGTPKSRMSDSFRNSPLWGTFIAHGSTRGTVRLDWPDTPSLQK